MKHAVDYGGLSCPKGSYHHPRISKLGICGPVMAIVLTDSKLETYPSRLYGQSVAWPVYMTAYVDEKMTVNEKLS